MTDLDATRIATFLDSFGSTIGRPVVVKNITESTNDDARQAGAAGAAHGAVFVADAQTRGRGRSGHSWHSPPGENLYLSVLLRPNIPPPALAPLTLVVGWCVARVVDFALGVPGKARIKWPNDVYVGEDKLAGILVETSLRGSSLAAVIVGVGLNVHTKVFPAELRATSLLKLGATNLDRSELAARFLKELGDAVRLFELQRIGPFHAELEARDMLRGRRLEIADVHGLGAGIDDAGFLRVTLADGDERRFGSGSVFFQKKPESPAGDPDASE